MPELLMICGPNGAGKSTFTRSLAFLQNIICIDPDAISATGLSPLAAGKASATMAKTLLSQKVSFARESTLTSHFDFYLMQEAKKQGYTIRLVYIKLASAEVALSRVKSRASKGGHDVPPEDVVRRFHRSLSNLPKAIELADTFNLLDNTEAQYSPVPTTLA